MSTGFLVIATVWRSTVASLTTGYTETRKGHGNGFLKYRKVFYPVFPAYPIHSLPDTTARMIHFRTISRL